MQTSENSTSSTFGKHAKRAAPWEVAQPSRCSAGQFYGTPSHLHTPSSHFVPEQCLMVLQSYLKCRSNQRGDLLVPSPTRPFSTTENQSLHAFRGVAIPASGPAQA